MNRRKIPTGSDSVPREYRLRRIAIRPARDYAKLQIMRLEGMVGKLTEKANTGDLAAIDRMLRTLDRLDRYHGFAKRPQKPAPPTSSSDRSETCADSIVLEC